MNLEIVLLLASIILTVFLAAVGVEVANNPPSSPTERWIYRSVFIILGGLLIGVTYWQGKRNIDERNETVKQFKEDFGSRCLRIANQFKLLGKDVQFADDV